MRRIFLSIVLAVLVPSIAPAEDFSVSWVGDLEEGKEILIHDYFAGPPSTENDGDRVVLVDFSSVGDCLASIDLGEVQRQGPDGRVLFSQGDLAQREYFYLFFVRNDDFLVHTPVKIDFRPQEPPGQPGQPVYEED